MLIAIMSDVYDRVQSTRKKEDVRERLHLIAELGKFLFWRRGKLTDRAYIHHCTNEKLQKAVKNWEGKVKVI